MSEDYGWVYFVRAGDTDLYKIGCTSQKPQKRLSSLQTASPHELVLQCAVEVDAYQRVEEDLHNRFSESRKQNEWFQFSEEDAQDVEKEMRDWLRHQKLDRATEPLKELSSEVLSDSEEYLTTVLADIARSIKYEYQEKGNAMEILKSLNRENLLPDYHIDTIERWLEKDVAREILNTPRTKGKYGYICLIKVEGTNLYRFVSTKQEPEETLKRPISKLFTGDSSEELALVDAFEVENIDQVKMELEETFSFLSEEADWLLLDSEGDLDMVQQEMRLVVREHQFHDLPISEISGDYVTDSEDITTDALAELVSCIARSDITGAKVLQALYIQNLLPTEYEDEIKDRLDDNKVRKILGYRKQEDR